MKDTLKKQKKNDENCEEPVFIENLSAIPVSWFFKALEADIVMPESAIQNIFTNKVKPQHSLINYIAEISTDLIEKTDVQPFQNSLIDEISAPLLKDSFIGRAVMQTFKRNLPAEVPEQQIHIASLKDSGEEILPKLSELTNAITVNQIKNQLKDSTQKVIPVTDVISEQDSATQADFDGTQSDLKTAVPKPVKINKTHSEADFSRISKKTASETEGENVQLINTIAAQRPDMETINVKVGEALNIYDNDFAKAVAEKIIFKQAEGVKQFDIELNPKKLGKINISIMFKEGKSVVSIACDNSKTQTLLNAHIQNIREIIELNTGSHTAVNVNQDESGMNKQENFDGQNRHNHREQQNDRPQKDETDMFIHQLKLEILSGA